MNNPTTLFLAVASLLWSTAAGAQEFRVYTRVLQAGSTEPSDPDTPVVARSLSLFRAGKVYDYVDPGGEVIVFEPAQRRFTVLNTSREVATTIDFDQIKHLLKVAQFEADKLLTGGEASAAQAPLAFQLQPEFRRSFDAAAGRLKLDSPHLTYNARCRAIESYDALDVYLRYADWIARLNYLLHPQALFPEPRLKLNAELRRLQHMPLEVELVTSSNGGVHLRAEHQYHWQLDGRDRELIHRWESMLRDKHTEQVTFQKYQQILLANSNSGAKR